MSDQNQYGLSDNNAGGIAYLTIIPAIAFLIAEPFKRNSFIRFHSWQSILFFAAWAVIDILAGVVQDFTPSAIILTLTLLQLVRLAMFIVWLIALVSAVNGKRMKLPVIGNFAEKLANR